MLLKNSLTNCAICKDYLSSNYYSMKNIESWEEDYQLRKSLYDIATMAKKIEDEPTDDRLRNVDDLPKRITIVKGQDEYDYVFTVFKQDHSGNPDAYFAMYSRRCQKQNSRVNYLFSVCGSSFPKVLNQFLFVYKQLCKLGAIKNENWKEAKRFDPDEEW